MDQQFESDVMHDLMTDSPTVSADEAFQESQYDDSFENDVMMDGMDQYDVAEDYAEDAVYFDENDHEEHFEDGFEDSFTEEDGDAFAENTMSVMDAMEEAVADALDVEDTDAFLRRLISAIRSVTGDVQRVARQGQRIAGQVDRVTQGVKGLSSANQGRQSMPRVSNSVRRNITNIIPRLQRHISQSSNEIEVFDDLMDWFEQEQLDEALPIVAGVAARTALRPVVRCSGSSNIGHSINRQIVRVTTQAAQNLTRRQGVQAVRALRPIAASIGRVAVHRGIRPNALPNAMRQAIARVATQPALTRRLAQMGRVRVIPQTRLSIRGSRTPRCLVLNGPVEIIIQR